MPTPPAPDSLVTISDLNVIFASYPANFKLTAAVAGRNMRYCTFTSKLGTAGQVIVEVTTQMDPSGTLWALLAKNQPRVTIANTTDAVIGALGDSASAHVFARRGSVIVEVSSTQDPLGALTVQRAALIANAAVGRIGVG